MKKIFLFMMLMITSFSLSACANGSNQLNSTPTQDSTTQVVKQNEIENTSTKSLVVYYSYSRNTRRIAQYIANQLNADIYEIRTIAKYPDNPHETAAISIAERTSGFLPDLVADFPNLDNYDTIYIGGPIWNAYMSTPLESYLKLTDFQGKTVVPFSTSMGSGQNGYLNDFKNRVQNPQKIGEYIDIQFPGNGQPNSFTDEDIDKLLKDWLNPNDYIIKSLI